MPALAGPGGYTAMDIPHNTTWEALDRSWLRNRALVSITPGDDRRRNVGGGEGFHHTQ
jgi:hypothetical protein